MIFKIHVYKRKGSDYMLWSIIVGGFIGFLAGAITNKGGAMGVIANVVAGLIGSSVGQSPIWYLGS